MQDQIKQANMAGRTSGMSNNSTSSKRKSPMSLSPRNKVIRLSKVASVAPKLNEGGEDRPLDEQLKEKASLEDIR